VMIADLIDSGAEEEERAHPAAKFLAAPYRPVVIATVVTPIASR